MFPLRLPLLCHVSALTVPSSSFVCLSDCCCTIVSRLLTPKQGQQTVDLGSVRVVGGRVFNGVSSHHSYTEDSPLPAAVY